MRISTEDWVMESGPGYVKLDIGQKDWMEMDLKSAEKFLGDLQASLDRAKNVTYTAPPAAGYD